MSKKLFTATAMAVGLVAIPTAASAETQFRVFGGLSETQDVDTDSGGYYGSYFGFDAHLDADTGFVIGAAVGVTYGNWLFEGEVSHRDADANELVWPTPIYETLDIDGNISSTAVMVNAWYNIDAGNNWTFYAGGGVGAAEVEAEFAFTGYYGDYQAEASDSGFAWQLGVGANYRTESGFAYGFGYRYFNVPNIGEEDLETDIVSHDFIFEVSRRF
jgi:opacity protein-like surface antigen